MSDQDPIKQIKSELAKGMALEKCRKCGCMKETLENLNTCLPSLQVEVTADLLKKVQVWEKQIEPIEYSCIGCEDCIPAVASNVFNQAFPESAQNLLSCDFEVLKPIWPPVPGEYFVLGDEVSKPVAVSTLASVELAEALAKTKPDRLCIVGKTETENIGIDKVVKNTVANPGIKILILAGKDPRGHFPGQTLLALKQHGVDEGMKVIGSPGKRPVLKNVTRQEVGFFREQAQVIDMVGCEDSKRIITEITEQSYRLGPISGGNRPISRAEPIATSIALIVKAKPPAEIKMDKAGYFVVIPQAEKGTISVEHYSYDNKLLRIIQGKEAVSIYSTIIEKGWATELSHAAYLGKELAKAEFSINHGYKYVQDGFNASTSDDY